MATKTWVNNGLMAYCLMAANHWADIDISLVTFCGIYVRENSQKMLQLSILDMSLKLLEITAACELTFLLVHLPDGDFEPERESDSDDEETIAHAEADATAEHTEQELEELQRESEMPIEELLKTLPPEVLEKPAPLEVEEEVEKEDDGVRVQ